MTKPAAVILAAGNSSRLGKPKQLLQLGDLMIIEHVLRNARDFHCDPIILVLGHKFDEIFKKIQSELLEKVEVVFNPNYKDGMSSSIKTGLTRLGKDIPCFVILGDQPLIDQDLLKKIWQKYLLSCKTIRPLFQGKPAHPVLLSPKDLRKVFWLSGDRGFNTMLKDTTTDVLEYEFVTDGYKFKDIDTIVDFKYIQTIYDNIERKR
ncbi:nucleotidyltransferase family protein [Cytobacillus oceanisediminis]|uniref:nucleotidyltransferase family protein n=1 Tax=Cytobacillus oceanisediminis TaxID=665099 RepID=UPI001C22B580|nr:nucleotidyltransferase family protein [Cytobacillus oceanisediminis]MBU8772077.1 nucleotidyltransferase family protein [Cytobacillus oceanisediminis]